MPEPGNLLDCAHFDTGRCRSCSWLAVPYAEQLRRKTDQCRALLGTDLLWEPSTPSSLAGFRNKAKLVVSGTVAEPLLGIVGPRGPVDLRDCPLHEASIEESLPTLAAFIGEAGLVPYDVAARRGELKYLLVTAAPSGELMVRFVLRSTEAESRIRKHLPGLLHALPRLRVAAINIQPEHKAILEGDREIMLTKADALPMRVNDVDLRLRPQSFFQTNTAVAAALYRSATDFVAGIDVRTAWDLYCGVGGFALHLAQPGRSITGVEISTEAVTGAQDRAPEGVTFVADDALAWVDRSLRSGERPDLVVVNPPRRGIGVELANLLDRSSANAVLYSSCNAETLARDLVAMPSLRARRARVFDMFPHTDHYEVLTLLTR